jgi:tRNA dimethylallyltransferase
VRGPPVRYNRNVNGSAPVVAIVGPTGAGKSDLALQIAATFSGEVVNCDSLQVYRHFDLGTAKLPAAERRGISHHLLDIVDPDQVFTAGEYARLARSVLEDLTGRGRLPVVAGGTGLYLRALFDGLFAGPQRHEALRERLARRESRHPGWLHRLLLRHDPEAAGRIHAADIQKLIRAAEVLLATRRPLSAWFATGRDALAGYRVLKLGLDPPRDALYQRVDQRLVRMFENGLLDEVRHILALGFAPAVKPLESHGYKQALQVIQGELKLSEAIYHAQRNTRRYAKRQWTWFRRDPEVIWLKGFGEDAGVGEAALARVRTFLGLD